MNQAALGSGELELRPLDEVGAAEVERLLRIHHDETGSPRAGELLADVPAALARFTAVVPTEYDRMVAALAAAADAGVDPTAPGAWDAILQEVTRG